MLAYPHKYFCAIPNIAYLIDHFFYYLRYITCRCEVSFFSFANEHNSNIFTKCKPFEGK